jgi:hypothetical protein
MKIWLLVLIMVFWNQQIYIKSFIIKKIKSLWNFWNFYKLKVDCSSKFKIIDEKNLEATFFNQQLEGSLIKKINLNSHWLQKKSRVLLTFFIIVSTSKFNTKLWANLHEFFFCHALLLIHTWTVKVSQLILFSIVKSTWMQ